MIESGFVYLKADYAPEAVAILFSPRPFIYVDEIMIARPDTGIVSKVKEFLRSTFKLKLYKYMTYIWNKTNLSQESLKIS